MTATEPAPIERLLDALVHATVTRGLPFLHIAQGRAWVWIDDRWEVELELSVQEHLVRRLGVLLGMLPPPREHWICGGLVFRSPTREVGLLVRVQRTAEGELEALVELVEPAELATRSEPKLPTGHPFR